MKMTEQQSLRDLANALMLDWAATRTPPFTGESAEGFPDAILAANIIAEESRLNLARWVEAARRAGMSWSELGEVIGISKQAAQQRFKPSDDSENMPRLGEEHVRIGATAFNEMSILQKEGEDGNELIRTGAFKLVFRKTDKMWEYKRNLGSAPKSSAGELPWTHVSTWLPFYYYKRERAE